MRLQDLPRSIDQRNQTGQDSHFPNAQLLRFLGYTAAGCFLAGAILSLLQRKLPRHLPFPLPDLDGDMQRTRPEFNELLSPTGFA